MRILQDISFSANAVSNVNIFSKMTPTVDKILQQPSHKDITKQTSLLIEKVDSSIRLEAILQSFQRTRLCHKIHKPNDQSQLFYTQKIIKAKIFRITIDAYYEVREGWREGWREVTDRKENPRIQTDAPPVIDIL